MAVYQIYKLLFNRSRQGNMLAKMDADEAYEKAQELLEKMLEGELPMTKVRYDKTQVSLDNFVECQRQGVTLLVVCNEKNHKYREKMAEHELVYHPGCRVIIDNRPGVAQIAIERSPSFENKTEKVRDILQETFCKLFDTYQLTVEIRAKMRAGTFWEAIDEQCKTFHDVITHVMYEFPDANEVGPIDTSQQNRDRLLILSDLAKVMNAARGVYHAYSDKEKTIRLDRTSEDLVNMVAMCCNNGYDISVHFKQYGIYRFGTEIKALSLLEDKLIQEFKSGQTVMGKELDGEFSLVQWLDEMRKITNNYNDEEPVAKKRKRRHKQTDEGKPALGRVADAQ